MKFKEILCGNDFFCEFGGLKRSGYSGMFKKMKLFIEGGKEWNAIDIMTKKRVFIGDNVEVSNPQP